MPPKERTTLAEARAEGRCECEGCPGCRGEPDKPCVWLLTVETRICRYCKEGATSA